MIGVGLTVGESRAGCFAVLWCRKYRCDDALDVTGGCAARATSNFKVHGN